MRVIFLWFDIVESENCNGDYVEVHADSEEGDLLGHYCGRAGNVNDDTDSSSSIANATGTSLEAETLWIKFNSDESETRRGFLAYYYMGTVDVSSHKTITIICQLS